MVWQLFSVLPNLNLQCTLEVQGCIITPPTDPRVAALREAHPQFRTFLERFRTTHGSIVSPAVMLFDRDAPEHRRSNEAMVALRNCLSISALLHASPIKLLYPHQNPILFSDTFEFYPWTLDINFNVMVSVTPAIWELHDIEMFTGQPLAGTPVQQLQETDIDCPLFNGIAGRWNNAFGQRQMSDFDRALFRSLNMANAALAMPAVRNANIFDYGRHCALWISAFEILAHHDSGRDWAGPHEVLNLLEKLPFWFQRLNARRYKVRFKRREPLRSVGLPSKLYAELYKVRSDFLHGNRVNNGTLLIKQSGRFIGDFAPLLYRCALRNFLELSYIPEDLPENYQDGEAAQQAADEYELPQYNVEQALCLARERLARNE